MLTLLQEIIPWGRTLREYELMFQLGGREKCLKILGCGDGPASFNAEWTALGGEVISIDPIYEFSGAQVRQRFEDVRADIMRKVEEAPKKWDWSFHKNPQGLLANRVMALESFLADYDEGRRAGRYKIGELPQLDFADNQFDLALCSHLLFLYSNLLSSDFHTAALLELCRVADEVRVFPLLDLRGKKSEHLETVWDALAAQGIHAEIETVPYEFQKGGNQMLRLVKENHEKTR